jgi:Protein of unknown function (DUF3833)
MSRLPQTLALLLSLAVPSAAFAAEDAMLRFFKGGSRAVASFSAINGVKRDFTVKLSGKWNGRTLSLREDFVYADGERARKTWRFTKTGEGRYSGTREDVIGAAIVRINGSVAKFNYLVDLDEGKGTNIVRFYDTIQFSGDGRSALNTAIVTKYGLPVAKVKVDFEK